MSFYQDRHLEERKAAVKLNFLGDIMLGRGVSAAIRQHGPGHVFAEIASLMPGAAGTIANLEAPFSTSGTIFRKKDPHLTFKVDPELVQALKFLRITSVTLANNHIADFGAEGIASTRKALADAEITCTGAGEDWDQASEPLIYVDGDSRQVIGILAFNAFVPFARTAKHGAHGAARFDEKSFALAVKNIRSRCTGIIASVHWGIDYCPYPVPALIDLAEKLITSHPEIVAFVGHHPHLQQPLIFLAGKPIFCSLGNFLFDEPFPYSKIGSILTIDIEKNRVADHWVQFTKLTENFRLVPLGEKEAREEVARIGKVKQIMEAHGLEYAQTDGKWMRYLLYQSARHWSANDFTYLLSLYSPAQILSHFIKND